MAKQEKMLNVQCFVKNEFKPSFTDKNMPKLLYVSKNTPHASMYPRMMHAHKEHAEIILICDGDSDYLINNKKMSVKTGDLVIFNSGIVHDEVSGPDHTVGSYCAAIGDIKLPEIRENALLSDDISPIFSTGESFSDIKNLYEIMFQSLSSGHAGSEAFCHYLMQALLSLVLDIIAGRSEQTVQEVEPYILGKRVKDYIDAHYTEPLTLPAIGEALHMSPYYLAHVFKEMTGYSPMNYLLRRRLGEAQTLLATTNYSIGQISEMVGYETQSYFNQQFTQNTGMPPKKYRQNYIVDNHSDGGNVK